MMSIWDLCIKRPVFTVMLVSAPIVLGLVSYLKLGVDILPNVEIPVVTVTTTLQGASVEEMETSVTKPIEEIVNTVSGIDELRSTTKEGISFVVIQFDIEKDRDVAAQEVRDKVNTILAKLPVGTDPPIIDKFDINAMPVMTVAVSGRRPDARGHRNRPQADQGEPGRSARRGSRDPRGGRTRAVNVYVDPDKLTSYNLAIEDVRTALMRQNLELPGGRVDQGERELVLRTMGRVENDRGLSGPDHRRPERVSRADPGRGPRRGHVRGTSGAGPPGRRERRQPDRPEANGVQHGGGRPPGRGPAARMSPACSRPTSRRSSSRTRRRSSNARSTS